MDSPGSGAIMKTEILGRLREEEGQGLVEYALILVLVAAVAVAGLTVFGGGIANLFQTIVTNF
jgi:pilus assembly protein Flp/PilA